MKQIIALSNRITINFNPCSNEFKLVSFIDSDLVDVSVSYVLSTGIWDGTTALTISQSFFDRWFELEQIDCCINPLFVRLQISFVL